MKRTPEQQTVIDHILKYNDLTLINAVAGSGKTTLLTEIAKELKPKRALYLAYNKAIATEASHKFPKSVSCLTTHALAYRTINEYNIKLKIEDRITYRILPNIIPYPERCAIIDAIEHFCVSEYLAFDEFAKDLTDLSAKSIKVGIEALERMAEGECVCSHGFYLKLFHIMLADGDIEFEPYDIIMLDEAGDINLVTLEIFKLLVAKKKVMVGDPHQNIYSFNRTVNCFALMQSEGNVFPLSQSFRVSDIIADRIESFCIKYLHEDMDFKGIKIDNHDITSEAYIARTNNTLITKMIELNELNVPYKLTRSPDIMFKVIKMLCLLKPDSYVSIPEYSYLQKDIDDYHKYKDLQFEYKTPLSYIRSIHSDDLTLSSALQLIFTYSVKTMLDCYHTAKKHQTSKTKHKITLGTAHSTKGLEFDKVTILPDMNNAISDIILRLRCKAITVDELTTEDRTELNLYYVACSRARKELVNATYL